MWQSIAEEELAVIVVVEIVEVAMLGIGKFDNGCCDLWKGWFVNRLLMGCEYCDRD